MFISIDHIEDMNQYIRKGYPVEPIIINLSMIVHVIPMKIYPNDKETEITKIQMCNHTVLYLPFPWEETMAMIRKSTKLSDFRVAIGDYYVEVHKYITPNDIDKSQLFELGNKKT